MVDEKYGLNVVLWLVRRLSTLTMKIRKRELEGQNLEQWKQFSFISQAGAYSPRKVRYLAHTTHAKVHTMPLATSSFGGVALTILAYELFE
jgi:hypothetical protein